MTLIHKPWGCYTDYFRGKHVVFKRLDVDTSESISYQYHDHRDELWYVVSGTGLLTVDDVVSTVESGDSVFINKGQKHKIECTSRTSLVIYEMQMGEPTEDDIVRLEDKYGRIDNET